MSIGRQVDEPSNDIAKPLGEDTAEPVGTTARLPTLLTTERILRVALPGSFLLFLLVLWEVVVRWQEVPQFLLPAPSAIWDQIVTSWSTVLVGHAWITIQEILAGFGLGWFLGVTLAIGIAYSTFLERTLYPLIVAAQAVPKIAIAPLFVVWLGFGLAPKILVTVLLVFFPIVVTTAHGLMSVNPSLVQLLRSVSANEWQIFRKVRMPHALPHMFSGMKIGVTFAVVGAVVGEWVGASAGLGYLILFSQSQMRTTTTFAAIALLVLIAVTLFTIISLLARFAVPWEESGRGAPDATV